MKDSRTWFVLVVLAGGGILLYLLAPVLTPFLIAALLAYVGDPLVDRLQARRCSRALAVVIVFVSLSLLALLLLVVLIPLLEKQVARLVAQAPVYLEWVQRTAMPWLEANLGWSALPDPEAVKQGAAEHWREAGGVVVGLLQSVSRSGLALLGFLASLVLVPVVTFYLLRDWDVLVERIDALLPRHVQPVAKRLARDADEVLGAFLRGQLLVMLVLGLLYSAGLWIVGLDYAVLIGMIAGLVSFVPYLGLIVGLALACTAAFFQFHDIGHLVGVAAVFIVGQVLESAWLTPWLVGDRIGLHPVAVIFAVLAFGQLFGFFGVLLALPAAAVAMVLLRYAHERYKDSALYDSVGTAEPEDGG